MINSITSRPNHAIRGIYPGHASPAIVAITVLWLCLYSAQIQAEFYTLEISRSAQALRVMQGNTVIKIYRVAFGKGGEGSKRRSGDNKTPIGEYRITGFKEDSKFYYFMQLSYPNLIDAWHGYRSRLIDAKEFRQIASAYRDRGLPPQDTPLGGYIGIHGIGETTPEKLDIHAIHNWTDGCIAMRNHEIRELRGYVSVGTPIKISR